MTSQELRAKLDAFPRIPFAEYPTPLQYLPNLSKELHRAIYIKRDDRIGPGLGGNKTRKLEYLMAEAQQRHARKVVTFGGLQSNHARITAAAALQCGMQPHLFYFEPRPTRFEGNLLINEEMGAKMYFFPVGSKGRMSMEAVNRLVHLLAWLRLGPHYFIPVGGHSRRGCLGYVRAACEIEEQARALKIDNAFLVTAAGTGGTLAGLLAGLTLINSNVRPIGIDVAKLWKQFPASIARLATNLCACLGHPAAFAPDRAPLIEARYAGQGYAIPSNAGAQAIERLKQMEEIDLDPVYTGKAFAGLLDLVRNKELGTNEPLIFLHTGGLPAQKGNHGFSRKE